MQKMIRRLSKLGKITDFHNIKNRCKHSVTHSSGHQYIIPPSEDEGELKLPEKSTKSNDAIIKCKRNELNYYNDSPEITKFDAVTIASKGWHSLKSRGDFFTIMPVLEDVDEEIDKDLENATFRKLGISSHLAEIVEKLGCNEPTMIQKYGIPEILDGQNTVIQAETGTGKTFTYLLPIINQIQRWKKLIDRKKNSPLALILTPSRELVLQIGTEAKKLTTGLDIHVKTLIGGRTKKIMRSAPVHDVDLLIGTVGVTSKLTTTRVYHLNEVRHTVLDEAHALFDETYDEKLSSFLKRINFGFKQNVDGSQAPISSQLTMTSATMPSELPDYFQKIIDINSLVPIKTKNVHRVLVPQKFMRLGPSQKPAALLKLIKSRLSKKESTIIFSNDTLTCDWISIFLNGMNVKTVSLHGNLPTPIRRDNYWKFRNGEINIISTTNSSARGLDTVSVDCVINYDFPMNTADYIHRCGRTGRIGSKRPGHVINFISKFLEIELTQKIERAARRKRALPLFDIVQQNQKKAMDDDIKQLLSSSK